MTALPTDLFTAIDHVGVAVPDLDAAIAFYRDTYGMSLVHEEVNEGQGVREAMMAVGDSGSCVQLLAPLTPAQAPGGQCAAGSTSSTRMPPASLGWMKLIRLPAVPRRGSSYSRRIPRSRSVADTASTSSTR